MSEPDPIPAPRPPERDVSIRQLRNAGAVISELAAAGAVGRVTRGGQLVGWLLPATEVERRTEDMLTRGRLRPGRPGGLAGRRVLPRRTDVPALSETLDELRREGDR